MKYNVLIFWIFLLLIIFLYVAGCRKAGSWLIKSDEPLHADAIVILVGSVSDRVLQATDLYKNKMANIVLVVQVNVDAYQELAEKGFHIKSTSELIHDAAITLGIPPDSIFILEGNTSSTLAEALIIREYLFKNQNIDTILLVTSAQHTRRASMIFNYVFKKARLEVKVLTIPSSYSGFQPERWWKNIDYVQSVVLEYLKIANFFLFQRSLLTCR